MKTELFETVVDSRMSLCKVYSVNAFFKRVFSS